MTLPTHVQHLQTYPYHQHYFKFTPPRQSTYLLRLDSIVRPIDTSKRLRIPAELVVACVGVYNGGAVVGAREVHCAFGVGLGGCEGKEEDEGEREEGTHCCFFGNLIVGGELSVERNGEVDA
jgi:hypothetical protein